MAAGNGGDPGPVSRPLPVSALCLGYGTLQSSFQAFQPVSSPVCGNQAIPAFRADSCRLKSVQTKIRLLSGLVFPLAINQTVFDIDGINNGDDGSVDRAF